MFFRFLLFFLIASSALAADSTFINTTTTQRPKRISIIPVPVIGYAPETQWLAGFVTGIIARIDTARPSTIVALATYSQNDQFRVYLNPDLYLGPWHTVAELEMRRWPDSYWGIGNHTSQRDKETYTPREYSADVSVQKKLTKTFGVGLHYALSSVRLLRVEPGRALDRAGLKDRNEVVSGPGASIFYDSRDNTFSPGRGVYLFGKFGLSHKSLGASSNYRGLNLDLRAYRSLHGSHVLAVQGCATFEGGSPPFTELPSIGNEYRLRGYNYGRFRDMNVLTAQIEYRFPLIWQIRGGLFAGAGDVADKVSHFSRPNFKHSLGGGLRWVILPKDKVCLRLDKAWGQRSDAFYLSLNEAF
ncbi:MAG TPA: BamA/TamA family outer membrane protein [bacterium]|jgi:outer membrane protein assembly factor BamA